MKILTISDNVLSQLEDSLNLQRNYADAEAIISCGDMPAPYLEFIGTVLNVPLFYVRGNHDARYTVDPPGGDNLHRRVVHHRGITMAGLEGCIRYNNESVQYSEREMFLMVVALGAQVMLQRAMGRGLDIMVAHSPPRDIHDLPDRAHRGFNSFRLLIRWYRPRYFIHGHVDTHDSRRPRKTVYADTEVLNINPVKLLNVETEPRRE